MANPASFLQETPRVCMPVFSSFANQAYRTGLMEAQDVLGECVRVDGIDLRARWDFKLKQSWLSRAAYHDRLRLFERLNPGLHVQRVNQDYDAFIAVCPNWRDLVNLHAVSGWEERCKLSICWIDELWAQEVRELGPWLRQLRRFDHVFVGVAGTARALELAIDKPCHELAGAVDTLRFCPVPTAPRRVIDLYSVGRRVGPIHAGMRRLAERRQLFYVYDTAASGDSRVRDHRAHRQMYAETAKRSRLFAMAPGKVDVHQTTGGQVDIGYRCFEGSAAGAVLVGAPPDSDSFRKLFDWEDAVIPLNMNGSDTERTLGSLLDNEARLESASRRNVGYALKRHDWVHRWQRVFEVAGLPVSPAMRERQTRLAEMADRVMEGLESGSAPKMAPRAG